LFHRLFISCASFWLVLPRKFLFYVGLQPSYDLGVKLFQIEFSTYLSLPLIHYVQYPFHIFFRQFLYIQSQFFLFSQTYSLGWGLVILGILCFFLWLLDFETSSFGGVGFGYKFLMAIGSGQVWILLRCDFTIIGFKLRSNSCELDVRNIKGVAVGYYLGNIGVELGGSNILVGTQVVLDSRKIHGLFYYFYVMRNSQSDWIHWLSERPGSSAVFEHAQNLNAGAKSLADVLKTILTEIFLSIVLLIYSILVFLSNAITVGFLNSASSRFGGSGVFNIFLNRIRVTFVGFFLTSRGSLGYSVTILTVLAMRFSDFGSIWNE